MSATGKYRQLGKEGRGAEWFPVLGAEWTQNPNIVSKLLKHPMSISFDPSPSARTVDRGLITGLSNEQLLYDFPGSHCTAMKSLAHRKVNKVVSGHHFGYV